MAVTIVKLKATASVATEFQESTLAEKVDLYGQKKTELEEAEAKLAPLVKLVADMEKDLLKAVEDEPADQPVVLIGHKYEEQFGKKSMKVVGIDKELLREILGDTQFFALASVGIGDIRAYCTKPQIEKVLIEERSGTRSKKLVKL